MIIETFVLFSMEIYSSIERNDSIAVVKQLIDDDNFAKYNRQHQMLYYRDLSIWGDDIMRLLIPGEDVVYKGFDFHHCFNYLYVKLSSSDSYPLREFDMYTLCDLANSRLNPKKVKIFQEGSFIKEDTFFHREKSNEKAIQVIEQLIVIIKKYLDSVHTLKNNEIYTTGSQEMINKNQGGTENNDSKDVVIKYFQHKLKILEVELAKRNKIKEKNRCVNDEKDGALC